MTKIAFVQPVIALLLAASTAQTGAPQPAQVISAEARAEIVRAETLTAANADTPRGEEARVHRDENGTAWVEFV